MKAQSFTADEITEVAAELSAWSTAYANYSDPSLGNRIVNEIVRRRSSRADRRGSIPKPLIVSGNVIESIMYLITRIYIFDTQQGTERHRGTPMDVGSIVRYIAYVAAGNRHWYAAITKMHLPALVTPSTISSVLRTKWA